MHARLAWLDAPASLQGQVAQPGQTAQRAQRRAVQAHAAAQVEGGQRCERREGGQGGGALEAGAVLGAEGDEGGRQRREGRHPGGRELLAPRNVQVLQRLHRLGAVEPEGQGATRFF